MGITSESQLHGSHFRGILGILAYSPANSSPNRWFHASLDFFIAVVWMHACDCPACVAVKPFELGIVSTAAQEPKKRSRPNKHSMNGGPAYVNGAPCRAEVLQRVCSGRKVDLTPGTSRLRRWSAMHRMSAPANALCP